MLQETPRTGTLIVLLAAALSGCALPAPEGRSVAGMTSAPATGTTQLAESLAPQRAAHPGATGIYLLTDPVEAFAAYTHLVRSAERSLDLQYYIWYDDRSGRLLLHELLTAAERGVRVRLLLDDLGTRQLDAELAALHSHPNIAVRLFNPFIFRGARWIDFLVRFERANRRMHNKVLLADGQAFISGGRNIGDSYFGATEGFLFSDLDILATGAVTDDVAQGFERYWQSLAAYSADRILPPAPEGTLETLEAEAGEAARNEGMQDLIDALRENRVMGRLIDGNLEMLWAPTEQVIDDPAKGLGPVPHEHLLTRALRARFGVPQESVDIISPFFIPTPTLTRDLQLLARRGVRVRVLTNSLAATDMAPAHAGYAPYRVPLLEAGVELYEMRRLEGKTPSPGDYSLFGASPATTLHTKAVVVDGQKVFIGSYNVDPRSVLLNTELGFIIESPALADTISEAFETGVPQAAYRLELDDGDIRWIETHGDTRIQHETEPAAGPIKRGVAWLFTLLPVEWLL